MKTKITIASVLLLALLTAQKPVRINEHKDSVSASGKASFYANILEGENTSSGDIYNLNDFTCAHRTLPFNTILCVTNTENGNYTIVRVNDRGPFNKRRIIDLSRAAAQKLGMVPDGITRIRIKELSILDLFPLDDILLYNEDGNERDSLNKPGSHYIHVWETDGLKQAIYMAASLSIDRSMDSLYIKSDGKGHRLSYELCIPASLSKKENEKMVASFRMDGFSLCTCRKN